MSGRRQFAKNAAASAIVSLIKAGLQLIMLPLMARLLGPTAYGIYALAFPVVMFFVLLADGGMGMSLAREEESNHIVWSTAFWTLLGTCTVMALGVFVSGFALARISGQPSLIGIMGLLAVAPILLAILLPADARLVRRGNLLWHSGSDLVATVIGAGFALVLAFQGAGAWSLAAQYIASFAVRAAILNAAAWSPPSFEYDFASLRGHITIGRALLITRLGELGGKFAENAVFEHIFGTTPLGAYTLAGQITRFSNDAVVNPVLGAFYAQALRESDEEVVALHARLARLVLTVLLPTTAMMAVAAPNVFPLILGPQWQEAAPIFRALVVPYALAATAWLSGQVLLKHGLTDRSATVVLSCSVLRIGAVGLGLWLTPVGVAWVVGGSYALQAIAMTMTVPQGLAAGIWTISKSLWAPAVSAAGAAGVSATMLAQTQGSLGWDSAAGITGGLIYILLLNVLAATQFREDLREITHLLGRKTKSI